MKEITNFLKDCSFFNGVDEEHIGTMMSCFGAKRVAFDKKYTIFYEGAPAKYIGIMLSGSALVIQMDYFGNRSIVSRISAGETFAEAFACAGVVEMPVSIVADEPCEVLLIDREKALHPCKNGCSFHNRIVYNLMNDLAKKNILFHERLQITSKRSTREKLLAYLNGQAKKNKSREFSIPFDRQELADYLEVERSGLSAEISKLREEEILQSHKNRFTLL